MDPQQSPDAEADFRERLGEALTKDTGDEPLVLGFLDASWPQPYENSQRMWSYDRTVEIDKPLVTVPWKMIGFYAILGKSALIFRKRTTKESICTALEAIREQNPVVRILLITDNEGGHHANSPNNGSTNLTSSASSSRRTHRSLTLSNFFPSRTFKSWWGNLFSGRRDTILYWTTSTTFSQPR